MSKRNGALVSTRDHFQVKTASGVHDETPVINSFVVDGQSNYDHRQPLYVGARGKKSAAFKTSVQASVSFHFLPSRAWSKVIMYAFGEFVFTLMLGLVGFFAANSTELNIFIVPVVYGLACAAFRCLFNRISLCHGNPMVTVAAFWLDSETSFLEIPIYSLAQGGGWILAALLQLLVFDNPERYQMVTVVDPLNSGNYSGWETFCLTLIIAAMWVACVAVATMRADPEEEQELARDYKVNALILGGAFLAFHGASLYVNGGALGLARSLMPSIVLWRFNPFVADSYWAIPIGNIVGGLIGVFIAWLVAWSSTFNAQLKINKNGLSLETGMQTASE